MSYATGVFTLMLVLSPLIIPLLVTGFHAVNSLRRK
jgi:hypothetical protein